LGRRGFFFMWIFFHIGVFPCYFAVYYISIINSTASWHSIGLKGTVSN
jgi:hypothetical protein